MKVLLFNGSTRKDGCTYMALSQVAGTLNAEGVETLRNLGRNMAWLLKCIALGREKGVEPPQAQTAQWTNFIR